MKRAVSSFSRTSQSLLASYGCYLLNYLTSIIITYILMCVEIDVAHNNCTTQAHKLEPFVLKQGDITAVPLRFF